MTCIYRLSTIIAKVTDHERCPILWRLNSADNHNYAGCQGQKNCSSLFCLFEESFKVLSDTSFLSVCYMGIKWSKLSKRFLTAHHLLCLCPIHSSYIGLGRCETSAFLQLIWLCVYHHGSVPDSDPEQRPTIETCKVVSPGVPEFQRPLSPICLCNWEKEILHLHI